jgi:hypothetical protein
MRLALRLRIPPLISELGSLSLPSERSLHFGHALPLIIHWRQTPLSWFYVRLEKSFCGVPLCGSYSDRY